LDVLRNASVAEFFMELVHVLHDEAISGTVACALPLLGIVPLKVKFHTVSPDGSVVRVRRGVREHLDEAQLLVEAH
jgi:hypothetical protein